MSQANNLLNKINEILQIKLEEINQLKLVEQDLCQKLNEKSIEFENQEIPYDQRQEILKEHIQKLQDLQVKYVFIVDKQNSIWKWIQNDRLSSIEQSRNQICQLQIELELDQVTENTQLLDLLNKPVHLIELSEMNVQQLLALAQQVKIDFN